MAQLKKVGFAQELSLLVDEDFEVPDNIEQGIIFYLQLYNAP